MSMSKSDAKRARGYNRLMSRECCLLFGFCIFGSSGLVLNPQETLEILEQGTSNLRPEAIKIIKSGKSVK